MSLAIILVMMSMRFCEWITNMKISGGGDWPDKDGISDRERGVSGEWEGLTQGQGWKNCRAVYVELDQFVYCVEG